MEVDGARLACFRQIIDPSNFTLVHFHGNGETVADYVPDMADLFANMGLNSLLVEYREYGESTGKAQLVAMFGDGEAAIKTAGLDPEKVIVFGRSIGSLYAVELASRLPTIAGLIIESGIADRSEDFLNGLDLDSANLYEADVLADIETYFCQRKKLAGFKSPLLALHAMNDGMIDVSHAKRICEWAGSVDKTLVRFPHGNHNTILTANIIEYIDALKGFVKVVLART